MAVGHPGLSVPGAVDVRLVRFPVGTARALVGGALVRPAHWHPEFPTGDTFSAAHHLLGAHEALEVDPERSPWWFFAVVVDELVVGDAGFHGPPPAEGVAEVEIGYQVVPAYRRRGVATRACALLLEHAWRNGAEVVLAETEPENLASRAVLRANGFRPTARGDFVVEAPVRPSA